MSTKSHRLFLLRAYGDATIVLYFLANSPEKNNYEVIASSHLNPLIKALSSYIDLSSLKIEFVDFRITKSQLNLFTNRHLISTNTLKQVTKLKQFVKNKPNNGGVDYVEQEKKTTLLNLFTGHSFKAIVKKQVYADMDDFFKSAAAMPKLPSTINKVLIVPDARISARRIPENIIEYIKTQLTGTNKSLQVAYYKKDNQPKLQTESQNEVVSYDNNTDSIIFLDFIISKILSPSNKPALPPVKLLISNPNCPAMPAKPLPLDFSSTIKVAVAWYLGLVIK